MAVTTTTLNSQQIAAAFAAKYMPDSTRQVLVSNHIVANLDVANRLSETDIAKVLYLYYLKNGKEQYGELLKQIPPATNLSPKDIDTITAALAEVNNISERSGVFVDTATSSNERKTFGEVLGGIWNGLIGQATTTTEPTVTVSGGGTKTSPATIAYVIGAIAIFGILAYVVVKS